MSQDLWELAHILLRDVAQPSKAIKLRSYLMFLPILVYFLPSWCRMILKLSYMMYMFIRYVPLKTVAFRGHLIGVISLKHKITYIVSFLWPGFLSRRHRRSLSSSTTVSSKSMYSLKSLSKICKEHKNINNKPILQIVLIIKSEHQIGLYVTMLQVDSYFFAKQMS